MALTAVLLHLDRWTERLFGARKTSRVIRLCMSALRENRVISPKRAPKENNEKIIHYQFSSCRHSGTRRLQQQPEQQHHTEQAGDDDSVTDTNSESCGFTIRIACRFTRETRSDTCRRERQYQGDA